MRVMVCLLLVLSACSTPAVRCDKHLEPINAPAAKPVPAAKIEAAAETATAGPDRSPP
jgi:hypothetical protein